ncbi:MAG: hypothetical protein HKP61_13615, partial [Dactylosporangium sp.]|nr:hypothetical protein [Dactylosporangium sp.]NNJ61952.1 hypothetical protein [Dactylosporangium sp.]
MIRPYLLVLGLSTFIVSRWFRTGTFIATGDMGPFIRTGWAPEAAWSWNHQVTGAGSASYVIARSFEFALIWCARAVGLGEYTAQWMMYTCIYGLVGFGVAYLAGAFVRSEAAIVTAGAFGVLNGFFLTRLPNPLNIISVGSIAFLTGLAMRIALGRRVPAPVAGFALVPTSFLAFNPPMLVVAYAWTVAGTPLIALLFLGRRPALRLLGWFARAIPWAVVLNLWWLVPLAQSFMGGGGATANATFTDPTNWSWSQVNNLPHNILTMVANWAWFRPQYLPFAADLDRPAWVWIRYLLPAVVFAAPVFARPRHRRLALCLLGLVVGFVVLAKGLRPPFIDFNMWLYLHIPGFWLFREPMSKLGQLLVLLFGLLLALYVDGMPSWLRSHWPRRSWPRIPRPRWWSRIPQTRWSWPQAPRIAVVIAGLPVLAVLGYPYPLYTGSVIPDERPSQPSAHVRVPQDWWEIAELIDQDPRPGKVLVLPLDDYYQMPTTWGFFGVDSIANLTIKHPIVQRHPDGYFGDGPGFSANVQSLETAMLAGDVEAVPRLLDALGVSEVIVRHDLIRGLPNRYFADDRILTAAMSRVPGARRTHSGMLELWQLGTGSMPTVRSYQHVLDAPARPDAGAAIIGSIPVTTAIAARAEVAAFATSPRVDDSPAVAPDAVAWPVPAVDTGPPTTTVDLPAGRYTIAQRARAATVLTPSVDDAAGQLVLTDPTTVSVDGVVRSRRPPLTVPLPDREVLAVRADARTVSLDGWGRDRLPNPPAAPSLAVGAATKLTLLAASAQMADVSDYSSVIDCNNYEPRPAIDLELSSEIEYTEEGRTLRLSASDHAACSTVTVHDAAPGRTYRIRLEYRSVEGSRPQICLFQTGTDGCELAARPLADGEWTPYERIVTVGEAATGLQITLHADVGERLKPPTVTEYRGLRVEALDAIVEKTIWPPAVPAVSVDLPAGQHELRVDGGLAGSVLAPFEELEDCFRYDDRTVDEAGLSLRVDTDERGETTYALGATSHLACIAATAPDFGASSLYEFSMEARSIAVRNPKFCVYLRGPDRCRKMPSVAVWDGWTPYEALLTPDPTAVETRVYLYGLRDLAESQRSSVEYRGVRLRPVASPVTVVLARETPAAAGDGGSDGSAPIRWSRQNPAQFTATAAAGQPTVLALAEH